MILRFSSKNHPRNAGAGEGDSGLEYRLWWKDCGLQFPRWRPRMAYWELWSAVVIIKTTVQLRCASLKQHHENKFPTRFKRQEADKGKRLLKAEGLNYSGWWCRFCEPGIADVAIIFDVTRPSMFEITRIWTRRWRTCAIGEQYERVPRWL